MKIFSSQTVTAEKAECCNKTNVRWLTTQESGTENIAMRLFEMDPDGYSPLHKHPEEHYIFVVQGDGTVFDGEKTTPIHAGDVVCIEANELHQIKNNSSKTLAFLCNGPYAKE
jgi:quercetin dioxygenase-like cupin family protein